MPEPALIDEFDPFDDFTLIPEDGMKLLENPDHSITLTLKMDNLGDGANYAFFNDITYVSPKVPTLMTALTTGDAANNATVYGVNTNSFVLQKGEIVEIVLNNQDPVSRCVYSTCLSTDRFFRASILSIFTVIISSLRPERMMRLGTMIHPT